MDRDIIERVQELFAQTKQDLMELIIISAMGQIIVMIFILNLIGR